MSLQLQNHVNFSQGYLTKLVTNGYQPSTARILSGVESGIQGTWVPGTWGLGGPGDRGPEDYALRLILIFPPKFFPGIWL